MQEPKDGLRFLCHAFERNDCHCFSHKKVSGLCVMRRIYRSYNLRLEIEPLILTKIFL